jgi:methylglutaconyl-CoA hydratase
VVERSGAVATVRLDRPEVRNAFDENLAAALKAAFQSLGHEAAVRVVVLRGSGDFFCAGGDLNWMRRAAALPLPGNRADARAFAGAFAAVDGCPKPVVARVAGAALGGGAGLVAASDVAVAAESAVFGFPEVKLGLIPAAISPYVIGKIGWSQARRLFLTGERFDARTAAALGLVHRVVADAALDAALDETVQQLLSSAPEACTRVKALLRRLNPLAPTPTYLNLTAGAIAEARASGEAREGLAAFLEKRKPRWAP